MRGEVVAIALALCAGACSKTQAPPPVVTSNLCQMLTTRLESTAQKVGAITDPKCPSLAQAAQQALAYKDGLEDMFGGVANPSSKDIGIVADFTHTTTAWAIEAEECRGAGNPEDAATVTIAKAKNIFTDGKASLLARCAAVAKTAK